MTVAQIREAARLVEHADGGQFATLLELGAPGCQLRLADGVSSLNVRGEWMIDKNGVSREVVR